MAGPDDPFEKENLSDEPFVGGTDRQDSPDKAGPVAEFVPYKAPVVEATPLSSSPEVENSASAVDLESNTPVQDLKLLLSRPRALFESLGALSERSLWIYLKVIVTFCFLSWFVGYFKGQREMEALLTTFQPLLDQMIDAFRDRIPSLLTPSLNPEDLRSSLAMALVTGIQLGVMLKPVVTLFVLLFTAATAYFFLPFVGVPKTQRGSFGTLYLAGVYANWTVLLGLLPIGGSFLASVAEMILYVLALKWIYRISFWKSFLALYVLGWLLVMATFIGGVFLIALMLAALGAGGGAV